MAGRIDIAALVAGCADDSLDDGIRIDSQLEPFSGPGGVVKPAVYEGGIYQFDRRWASPTDGEPTQVIVIDNDTITGGAGNDTIVGSSGDDSLIFGRAARSWISQKGLHHEREFTQRSEETDCHRGLSGNAIADEHRGRRRGD